jgi:hypothetical protein
MRRDRIECVRRYTPELGIMCVWYLFNHKSLKIDWGLYNIYRIFHGELSGLSMASVYHVLNSNERLEPCTQNPEKTEEITLKILNKIHLFMHIHIPYNYFWIHNTLAILQVPA